LKPKPGVQENISYLIYTRQMPTAQQTNPHPSTWQLAWSLQTRSTFINAKQHGHF